MKYFERLKEPSTWAGIAALVGVFAPGLVSSEIWPHIVTAGIAIAGVAAILLKETCAQVQHLLLGVFL